MLCNPYLNEINFYFIEIFFYFIHLRLVNE